ncbi:MAG: protein kinase [Myxococcaceae bacterium]|nr:protein kinase [Myxococcaceae bacterium]
MTARQILIAEDDDGSRALLEKQLKHRGYAVTSVGDGELALAALKTHADFDAVLLDVMMPRMSGFEVLRQARAGGITVPIIMATAAAAPEDIVAALDAGADDYVTKPFNFPVLVARLEARLRATPAAPKPMPKPVAPVTEDGLVARLKAIAARIKPAAPIELKPGVELGGRYAIVGRLGAGSFGTVYQARHIDLEQDVAVKVLTRGGERGSIEALRKEAQRACRVRHPNAVRVVDFGLLPPSSAFLVMEMLDGETLDAKVKKGRLGTDLVLPAVRGVLGALAVLHKQGLVHRDVKPGNVLMHKERGGETPKLIDFGTARSLDEPDEEEAILGSPAYVSPERIRGDDYDGKSDVYSCGVMLYRLLAGALPIPGDTHDLDNIARWHLTGAAPPLGQPKIDGVIRRLLAKNPADRPNAEEAESLVEMVVWG